MHTQTPTYTRHFRWLKTLHISVGSEVKQRALAKDILGDNLVAEMGAFTFRRDGGGEDIKEAPFVYVPNLIKRAVDLIEEHKRYNDSSAYHYTLLILSTRAPEGLTWHQVIPRNEIWLKLGGDKGHGSFKLNLQLCNIQHPNSQRHTTLLSMCMAGDSITNLTPAWICTESR